MTHSFWRIKAVLALGGVHLIIQTDRRGCCAYLSTHRRVAWLNTALCVMKHASFIVHLSIPAFVTLGAFVVATWRESYGMEMFSAYVLDGYLFYAAPYLLWAVVATIAKVSHAVRHAGFIASSIALIAIASLWLSPQDTSGLPLQWMLYWPLAIVLQIVIAGGIVVYRRAKKTPNQSINTDAAQ
jgi:hypothetical protein